MNSRDKQLTVSPFIAIRFGEAINGSKLAGALAGKFTHSRGATACEWLTEIAWRFIRRFHVLAADAPAIEEAILGRHCKWKSHVKLPNKYWSIGLLYAAPDGKIKATAHIPSGPVATAARKREEKISAMNKRRITPTGPLRQAWILSIETEVLLHELSKEQSGIRRQQSAAPYVKRRRHCAAGEDHGARHQQHP
jgi:hypothetical protein